MMMDVKEDQPQEELIDQQAAQQPQSDQVQQPAPEVVPLMEDKRVLNEMGKMVSQKDQKSDEPWAVKRLEPYQRQNPQEEVAEVKQPEVKQYDRTQAHVEYPSLSMAPTYLPEEFKNLRQQPNQAQVAQQDPQSQSNVPRKYSINQEQFQQNFQINTTSANMDSVLNRESVQSLDQNDPNAIYKQVVHDEQKVQQLAALADQHNKVKDTLARFKGAKLAPELPETPNYITENIAQMQFRELNEFDQNSQQHNKKLYVVHEVNPMTQTFGQICMHYGVNKNIVKQVNKMFDEDIGVFKHILIPCQTREQMLARGVYNPQKTPAQQAYYNESGRRATLVQLTEAIKVLEKKHIKALIKLGQKREIPKAKDDKKYEYDAEAYLQNNNYDFQQALNTYKTDLQREIAMAQADKELKKLEKPKKKGFFK